MHQFSSSRILPSALFHSRQKKEGAIPCRVSGEAVGCPVRSTEEKAPIGRAHFPPRSGSYWSKLPTFHQSQNSAANAKSCVVWRILYLPPFMGKNLRMCTGLAQASASPSAERAYIAFIQYFTVYAKILRGELENVANVEVLPIPV